MRSYERAASRVSATHGSRYGARTLTNTEWQSNVEFNEPLQALQDAEVRERESDTFEGKLV
ncbi:MAG: hypothetical protein ICV55_14955 [Coleofasciculus sp. C3-bin4]|nr:hypothetical protein [Coleofasciculus sp. C3-bin4]